MTTIDDVIARIPDWQGRDVQAAPLSGGLTNSNYRVDVDGGAYVVRIPGQSTELLSVNRQHEYHNTLAAAQAGVGAQIGHYLPDIPVMVLEFIPGPTMSGERLRDPSMIARIARSVVSWVIRITGVGLPGARRALMPIFAPGGRRWTMLSSEIPCSPRRPAMPAMAPGRS